jgi:ABC-type branched-subunit amino acid transport system substrate-binding protein
LQSNPKVLAVIGHSSSDTTRAAAPLYAEAQIPLLVPIATSPLVAFPETDWWLGFRSWEHPRPHQRLRNVFQLIPNDKIGQAPAIAYAARALLHTADEEIVVVTDLSDNTNYARPLGDELHKLLPNARLDLIPESNGYKEQTDSSFQLSKKMFPGLFPAEPRNTTVVIFVGTAHSAERFLPFLISSKETATATIILTDGAKDFKVIYKPEFTNLHIFLTFPLSPLAPNSDPILQKALRPTFDQSYETYGIDSMLMIGMAIDELCPAGSDQSRLPCSISRSELLGKLHEMSEFVGVADEDYLFNGGENVHPEYYIYGSVPCAKVQVASDCAKVFQSLDFSQPPILTRDGNIGLQYYFPIGFDEVHRHRPTKELQGEHGFN